MSQLPLRHVRNLELAGLLFADQGAEVYVERPSGATPGEVDEYLDRGKTAVLPGRLSDTTSADVVIVDGDARVNRTPAQIVLRVTAALPGDKDYGHLPADCSEDLLNALTGFFTDMSTSGRFLGRPVIYTPLPLCLCTLG
jgi:hypothetical protein